MYGLVVEVVGVPAVLGTAEDLLCCLDEAVLVADLSGSVVYANPPVLDLLGWEPADLIGRELSTIIPERLRDAHAQAFARYRDGGTSRLLGHPVRLAALHRDGAEVPIELLLSRGPAAGTVLGLLRQIDNRIDVDRHDVVTEQLLRVVAERHGGGTDALRVLSVIGGSLAWDVAVLWGPVTGGRHLRCEAFWQREELDLAQFRSAAEGSLLPFGVGIPGSVWETGEATWVADLGASLSSPVEDAAAAAGLTRAVAFPLRAGGGIVGVVELLDRVPRERDNHLVETMMSLGRIIGEFLDRVRHDEERRRLLAQVERERARLEAVQRWMPSAVLVADAPSGRVVAGNDMLDTFFGEPTVEHVEDGERFLDYRFVRADGSQYPDDELPFVRAARTGETIDDAELEFIGHDGSPRILSVSAAPIRAHDGRVVSAVATFHDVTYRRRLADRQSLLSEASAAVAGSLDYQAGLGKMARLAVGVLADLVVVHLERPDGSMGLFTAAYADDRTVAVDERLSEVWTVDIGSQEGVARVVREGSTVVYDEVSPELLDSLAASAEQRRFLEELQICSAVLVPLHAATGVVGVLSFISLRPQRTFDREAVTFAEDLGRRVSIALANARLFERERAIAATLQTSLLPRDLPDVPGFELAARFLPGGEGVDVGGDFYDVFRVGSATAVVIGDVCGKGAEAAALTAQFRFTARALSDVPCDPAHVLTTVDAKVQETRSADDSRFCTAVYLLLESHDGERRCSAASAGHPLPLVVRADGTIEEVDCRGSLLFVLDHPIHRTTTFDLGVGDAVVLYTDGVTEARGERGFFGDGALRSVLGSCVGSSAESIAARVAEAAIAHSGGRACDDICVVVAVAQP